MIRIEHIIKKDEIFNWIMREDICHIEASRRNNKGLKDQTLCKIYAFHRINEDDHHVEMILGSCKKVVAEHDAGILKVTDEEHGFLAGLQNQLHYNWLSKSMINKLIEIQSKIPK